MAVDVTGVVIQSIGQWRVAHCYSRPDPAETDQSGPPRPVHKPGHIDLDCE